MANSKCVGMVPTWVQGKGIERKPCEKGFRVTHPDQKECPKCGGHTEIRINEDQTVKAVWTGPIKRGSLRQLGAQNCAELANQLDTSELWAVVLAVKECPFPFDSGKKVYSISLDSVRKDPVKTDLSLGELRHGVVLKGMDGFNAPTDNYLQIAVTLKDRSFSLNNLAQALANVGDYCSRQGSLF